MVLPIALDMLVIRHIRPVEAILPPARQFEHWRRRDPRSAS
jgi:hypothetical protein